MRREETVDFQIRASWYAIARMYNQLAAEYDATMASGYVLLNINADEGTPATKIAPLMGLESRSLTRILKNLEETGLICREHDQQDRRSVRIVLTPEGKKKKEKAREAVLSFNEMVRERIPAEKLDIFFEVLADINKVVESISSQEKGRDKIVR